MGKRETINLESGKENLTSSTDEFLKAVVEGLAKVPKCLPSKFLYDEQGSEIFEKITNLPEYYVTRTERSILRAHKKNISKGLPKKLNVIELGAGDGHKTKILISELLSEKRDVNYIPIDISPEPFEKIIRRYQHNFNSLDIYGIIGDYIDAFQYIFSHRHKIALHKKNFILLFGSSIGNLSKKEEREFFTSIRKSMKKSDLFLTGFDLKKNPNTLLPAYSDSQGITAKFNINLLRRINRELDADFQLSGFAHYAFYNPAKGAMESYLLSKKNQRVQLKDSQHEFFFKEWEPIHMEFSYKYTPEQITQLAKETRFSVTEIFFDKRKFCAMALFRAE